MKVMLELEKLKANRRERGGEPAAPVWTHSLLLLSVLQGLSKLVYLLAFGIYERCLSAYDRVTRIT